MNPSDQELIQQLVSNEAAISKNSWLYVYKTYHPMVYDMILQHNGSEADAVDIFQDGLVILDRNLKNGTFRQESSLKTYLFSICKNLWLKEFNKKNKQTTAEAELMRDSHQDFEYLINVEIITLLMNELGEDCRKILIEYYYNNKSMAELKDMFNVNSIQAAKNKKWRCLTYLTKLFKERGATHLGENN